LILNNLSLNPESTKIGGNIWEEEEEEEEEKEEEKEEEE